MDTHKPWTHVNYGNYHTSDIHARANYGQDIRCQRDNGDRRLLGSNRDVHVRFCSCSCVVIFSGGNFVGGCGCDVDNFGVVDNAVGDVVGVMTFGGVVGVLSDVGVGVAIIGGVGDVAATCAAALD